MSAGNDGVCWGTPPASVARTRHRNTAMVLSAPDTNVITNKRTPVRTERRWSTSPATVNRRGACPAAWQLARLQRLRRCPPLAPLVDHGSRGRYLSRGRGSSRMVAACAGRHAIEAVDQAGDGPLWARSSLAGGRARSPLNSRSSAPESAQVSRMIFYVSQVSGRERLVTVLGDETKWACRGKTPCQVTLMPLFQQEIRI